MEKDNSRVPGGACVERKRGGEKREVEVKGNKTS
jgi:hypothetical protein